MDEPFSALEVLTAQTQRTELLDLWQAHRVTTRSILRVARNVEAAVLSAGGRRTGPPARRPGAAAAVERAEPAAPSRRFVAELEDPLSHPDAEHAPTAVGRWGRYAERFGCDETRCLFTASAG